MMTIKTTGQFTLLPKIQKVCDKFVETIIGWNRRTEAIKGFWPEYIVMVVYSIAFMIVSVFHEPWFDEAEAWQIARCTTLKTLLFETTHYEGHPPLWHLVLKPFAKMGAPYELSLTLVSFAFAGGAVWLILRYSPFPRLLKLLLPYTYFLFYQYGVVARVYSLMTFEFILLAIAYRKRNEKPGWYVLVMMLMCTTHAYGMIIAGGLAVCWLLEMWNGQKLLSFVRKMMRDSRIWWLFALLVVAILVVLQIMPREDTYAVTRNPDMDVNCSLLGRMLYTFFMMLSDTLLTCTYDQGFLIDCHIGSMDYISGIAIGMALYLCIWFVGKKSKTRMLFFLPYTLLAACAAVLYLCVHHIGISFQFLLFWLWVTLEDTSGKKYGLISETDKTEATNTEAANTELPNTEAANTEATNTEAANTELPNTEATNTEVINTETVKNRIGKVQAGLTRNLTVSLCVLSTVLSVVWSLGAVIQEIRYVYEIGRNEAAFIKEHKLDQYRIMAPWLVQYDEDGEVIAEDSTHCNMAANVAPYFERNIFYNYNGGVDELSYNIHKSPTDAENLKNYENWRKQGIPDVLFGNVPYERVYSGEEVKLADYALVYYEPYRKVWKTGHLYHVSRIYVRRELLEATGLEEINMAEMLKMQREPGM